VADEPARWAAQRAPQILARAEDEAVAVLRDALVEAAMGRRRRTPPAREPAPEPKAGGEVLWAYCVLPSRAASVQTGGVAGGVVEQVEAAGLTALAGRVPAGEFGAEPLRENLNDLAWLERVAREHEAVLEHALGAGPIVPLRLCTIFEGADGLRRMLEREHDALKRALAHLEGREEWGVKLLVDPERLTEQASPGAEPAGEGGAAYLERRRNERATREAAHAIAAGLAEDVHARLRSCAIDAVTRPAQNRELSGHDGEMLLNAAYLVEAHRLEELHALVAELEQRHSALGARLELTGPWPPYNFVPGATSAELA
jgi:gas vesicle protein GvpL/GvpF